jgi:fructose-1,6-bisphosphatase/inositol monophosphatase family enzyme
MRFPGPDRVAALMREAAEAIILPRWKALTADEVREKTGPKDLVTIADLESERFLTPALAALLPGSVVLGEEAASADPAMFDRLTGDDPVWIIDPVDGTRNFTQGSRLFCVMVALTWRGVARLGVILDPLGERWAAAEQGGGAEMAGYDGGRIRLSATPPAAPEAMRGSLNFRFLESPLKEAMRARADAAVASHHRLGCAGHEYLRLAAGEWHFSMHAKNMPWDHVAGLLIHGEAGGHHARFDGRPYRPHELEGGLLAAPDEASWQALRRRLWGEG